MDNRRDFIKKLGIGAAGAGAFLAVTPQLPAANASSAPVERFRPGPELLDRNMIYEFRMVPHRGHEKAIMTANPREEYRAYLVDLYCTNVRQDGPPHILMKLIDKSLELAMERDTRGWSVEKWNKELLTTHQRAAVDALELEWRNERKSA